MFEAVQHRPTKVDLDVSIVSLYCSVLSEDNGCPCRRTPPGLPHLLSFNACLLQGKLLLAAASKGVHAGGKLLLATASSGSCSNWFADHTLWFASRSFSPTLHLMCALALVAVVIVQGSMYARK